MKYQKATTLSSSRLAKEFRHRVARLRAPGRACRTNPTPAPGAVRVDLAFVAAPPTVRASRVEVPLDLVIEPTTTGR